MVILPSLAFSYLLSPDASEKAKNGFKYSCIIFLILGLYLYKDILGGDYRSIQHVSDYSSEDLISPMAFSSIGLSLFGILLWELINKGKRSFFNFSFLILSIFAMVWGGTRSSILAGMLVLLTLIFFKMKNAKDFLKMLLIISIASVAFIYILDLSGSKILSRFDQLVVELQRGDKDAGSYRLGTWTRGLDQFLSQPILGSGIEEKNSKYVAHNMYLESFMSTGFLGGFLFLSILFVTFRKGKRMLLSQAPYSWLMVLFLTRLFTGMMSTSILDPLLWLPIIAINSNFLIYKKEHANALVH
ncbi:hypothetical protein GCM10008086_09760 [Salegentibacter mishustinae]|nr:hypothetical protein APB85_01935 [Salegentibacter mishustinae]GGW83516.1 hypothetical protein GCM10008086_09760 [Salegentibacter mishustinae]